ncbi:MAG: hypothetical protein M1365_13280 [Actinobacteria bacterium]|nr:hypothetical protein [Actinomycetota bacterium]
MGVIKTFADIVGDVATRLKISNTIEKASVKTWVNLAYRDFQIRSDFYWRKRQDTLQVIPFYETGTVAVTIDSRTVTGTSTVWTSAMEGRYIQFSGESSFYKIAKVNSATSITLDQPYTDDTNSGITYKIYKRFYNLISDVDEVLQFYSEDDYYEPLISQSFLPTFYKGTPTLFQKVGIDTTVVQYTTGTVSGTINTRTITGVGTSWIANVQKGDLFTPVGGSTYNVLSVDSDTQLTLVQNLLATVTAVTYTIQRQDLTQIEFNTAPDETTQMHYDYLKKTFDMLNDNDEPEIPLQYRDVLNKSS